MILLLTTYSNAKDCGNAITQATSEPVKVAAAVRTASVLLKAAEFTAVVIDQHLQDVNPDETERLLMQIGVAVPVYVNLAISGTERIIRDIRIALQRREREMHIASDAAEQKLRNDLKDVVTALLLSCEMVLRMPSVSSEVKPKLLAVNSLVQQLQKAIGLTGNCLAPHITPFSSGL